MATVTSLGFSITSKYDPKGMAAARADIHKFSEDLNRISKRKIKVDVKADPVFDRDFDKKVQERGSKRNAHVLVHLDPMVAEFRQKVAAIKRLRANVHLDPDSKMFQQSVRNMKPSKAAVDVDLNEDAVRMKLDALAAKSLSLEIQLEVDEARAINEIARLKALRPHIEAQVELDMATAQARLVELQQRNERNRINLNVDVDTAGAEARIRFLTRMRRMVVNVAVNDSGSLMKTVHAARYLALALGGVVAAFFVLGQAAVMVGALMTAALGGGVIAAGIAAIAINKKVTESHQKAAQAAADQARTAQQQLTSAYANVARVAEQGNRRIEDARRRVTSAEQTAVSVAARGATQIAAAERTHANAVRDSQAARAKLNDAYRDSQRELDDLHARLENAPTDEKGAEIAVKRAMEAMHKLGEDGEPVSLLDREEAQQNIDEALNRLEEVRRRNAQLREDVAEADAKGVEGSEQVLKAKEAIHDADQKVVDSAADLTQTRRDVADANAKAAQEIIDAQRGVVEAQQEAAEANAQAQEQVTRALEAVNKAQREVTEAQEKQNGIMAQAAQYFADIAEPIRGPLMSALERLKVTAVEMKPALMGMFAAAGPLVQPFSDAITGLVGNSLPGMTAALNGMQPTIAGFRDGMSTLGTRVGAMFAGFTAGAEGLGNTWRVAGNRFGEFLQIFGERTGQMSQKGSESLDKMFEGVNRLVDGMMSGLAPALEHMAGGSSVWFSIFAGIGTIFETAGPAIGQFSEAVAGLAGPVISSLAQSFGVLLAGALPGLSAVLIALTPVVAAIAQGFSDFVRFLQPVMPVLGPVIAGIWLLNAAMAANPVGLVVIGIAALIGGITFLLTKTDALEAVFSRIGQAGSVVSGILGPAFSRIGDAFRSALEQVKQTWETHVKPALDGLVSALQPLWQEIQPLVAMLGAVLMAIVNIVLGVVEHGIKPVFNALGGFIGGIIQVIQGGIQILTGIIQGVKGAFQVVIGIVQTVVGVIKGIFTGDWSMAGDGFKRIIDGLKGMFEGIQNIIGGFVNILKGAWDAVYAIVSGAIGLVIGIVRGFIQGIIGFFEWLYDVLVGHSIVPDLMKAILGLFQWLLNMALAPIRALVDLVVGAWNWIFQKGREIFQWIKDKWNDFVTGIKIIWDIYSKMIGEAWGRFWGGIRDFFAGIARWIKEKWDEFWQNIEIIWNFYSKIISEAWNKFWDDIRGFFEGVVRWIKDKWDDFWKGIDFIWNHWKAVISEAWSIFWDSIKKTASDIWDKIKKAFEEFGTGIRETLDGIVKKAGEIWDKIKGIFATPINFVIGIWNDHIADKIGLSDKKIPKIEGYADGGHIGGHGHGRADDRLARVSSGEYIINAKSAANNRPLLDAINYGGAIPKFADGGPVEWMVGWVKDVMPQMGVTSTYRTTDGGYHSRGKAADFAMPMNAGGLADMMSLAQRIASEWGANTAQLIHGNGFQNNIAPTGRNVGDGMGFYGAVEMANHNNHVHWAVDQALDGEKRGGLGGLLDGIGDAIGGIVNKGRELLSDLFKRLTNPLLDGIPDPFVPGMNAEFGRVPKGFATTARDGIAEFISSKEDKGGGPGTVIGGVIPTGDRLRIIEEALKLTSTPPPGTKDEWLRGMNTLIERESSWNPNSINNWDSNAAKGTPSKGLAQTIDPTFQSNKVPGYDNIWDPVSNVAASINYIKREYGGIGNVQQAQSGMAPRGYADGTKRARPGLAWVGELGPELMKFRGGEEVVPHAAVLERIRNVKLEERIPKALGDFVMANVDQFKQDIGAGGVGDGAASQAFKQGIEYAKQLQEQQGQNVAQVHYHVTDIDEALRKQKQREKEQAAGF